MLAPQGLHVQPGILCQPLLSAQRHHLLFLLWPVPQWLDGVQIAAGDLLAACELLASGVIENENEAHLDTWDGAVPQMKCGDPRAGTQLATCVQRELCFTALQETKADRPFTSDFFLKAETSGCSTSCPLDLESRMGPGLGALSPFAVAPSLGRHVFYCKVITVRCQESAQGNISSQSPRPLGSSP